MENLQAHHEPLNFMPSTFKIALYSQLAKFANTLSLHLCQSLFHISHGSRAGESEERTSSRDLLSSLEVSWKKVSLHKINLSMMLFQVSRPLLPPRAKTCWKLWVPQSFIKSWKKRKNAFFSRIPPRCGMQSSTCFNQCSTYLRQKWLFWGPSEIPRGHF